MYLSNANAKHSSPVLSTGEAVPRVLSSSGPFMTRKSLKGRRSPEKGKGAGEGLEYKSCEEQLEGAGGVQLEKGKLFILQLSENRL